MTRPFLTVRAAVAAAIFGAAILPAQPPPGYYDSVDDSSAEALRRTLHEIIDDHASYMYDAAGTDTWTILEQADQDPSRSTSIVDVYRNASFAKGSHSRYHREHTWPKSHGFPDYKEDAAGARLPRGVHNAPYTDCHHLFLADAGYNSSRGNNPYGTCDPGYEGAFPDPGCEEKVTERRHGRGGGEGEYPGWSNWRSSTSHSRGALWEAWRGRRGDVARAQFYMDVRYEGDHDAAGFREPNLVLTDKRGRIISDSSRNRTKAYMGLLSDLILWHLEDPVDGIERQRHDVVSGYQKNRNPFIDHPEWVECLYLGFCGDVVFADSFESGDASAWSREKGNCEVVEPGLNGTPHGLAVPVDGKRRKSFVSSKHPAREESFSARFFLNANGVDLGGGEVEVARFVGGGKAHVRLTLDQAGKNYWVKLYARHNKGGLALVGRARVPGRREVEIRVDWSRASAPGASDGVAKLFKNGKRRAATSSLDNDRFVVGAVLIGLPAGSAGTGAAGEILFDEYVSTR